MYDNNIDDASRDVLDRMVLSTRSIRLAENDLAFDPYLTLSPLASGRVTQGVAAEVNHARERAPTKAQSDLQAKMLSLVIANVAVARSLSRPVHYSRNQGEFAGRLYEPTWLRSTPLIRLIDQMAEVGLVANHIAERLSWTDYQSALEPMPKLLSLLDAHGISYRDVDYLLAERPAVTLKDALGKPVAYLPHDAQALNEGVRKYNEYMRWVTVSLRAGDREILLPFRPVVRMFNGGSFDLGGRFFRGVAQGLTKAERPSLLLNGEPTIELDYSGFSIRAAYHQRGLTLDTDPYDIHMLRVLGEAYGGTREQIRADTKVLANVMLNLKSKQGRSKVNAQLHVLKCTRPYYDEIENHHSPIRGAFYSSYGLRLMNLESAICERIILQGVDSGIPVLPVHDAYVVRERDREWLYEQMNLHYRSIIGGTPVIH